MILAYNAIPAQFAYLPNTGLLEFLQRGATPIFMIFDVSTNFPF